MNRSRSVLHKNITKYNNILADIEPENQTQPKNDFQELKTMYSKSPYSLKLQKIIDELSKIDPDSLMKQVDPTINSTKTAKAPTTI